MDNFDLRKFLKESKALENLNPIIGKENINENDLRNKIREMIMSELGGNPSDYDYEEEDVYGDYDDDEMGYFPTMRGLEDEPMSDELEEAKKKKEEEVADVEVTDTETEDVPVEDVPAEEAPAADGGLEDIAANMEGTESELMQNLMDALKIAKGMNNEKLETQIGNTLKFFVSEYIGGSEQ
jgi:hypothetical protein